MVAAPLTSKNDSTVSPVLLFYWMEQNSLISETKAVGLKTKTKLPVFWSVTHPPTLDNLLLQVCGCYDQHADGLQKSWMTEKQEIKNNTNTFVH